MVTERARSSSRDLVESGGPDDGAPDGDRADRHRGDRWRFRLGHVQRRARRRHAPRSGRAGIRSGRRGDPLRRTRQARDGRPAAGRRSGRDRAVECTGHPRHARRRDATRVREHGRTQGIRDLPADALRGCPGARRRRAAERRYQPDHQRAGRCRRRRRRADRASGDAADQLHRLDQGRKDHRRERRPPPQARAARARRQGADDRPARRRSGSRSGRRELRGLLPPGPDLHVDRTDPRRPGGVGPVGRQARRSARARCRSAIPGSRRPRSDRSSTPMRSRASARWSRTRSPRAPPR